MDHPDPRTGMHLIDRDECMQLLADHQPGFGRLAVVEGTKPTIIPVNYAMLDQRIVFRSGAGLKLEAAERGQAVAFEIDRIDHDTLSGWSVVVRGRAEVITRAIQLAEAQATELEPYVDGKDTWVIIHPEIVTGRRLPAREV